MFETRCKMVLRAHVVDDPALHGSGETRRALVWVAVDRPKGRQDRFLVVAWGDKADEVNEQVMRGQLVDVDGSCRINEWRDRSLKEHVTVEVHADLVRPVYKDAPGASTSLEEPAGRPSADAEHALGQEEGRAMDTLEGSNSVDAGRELASPAANAREDLPW